MGGPLLRTPRLALRLGAPADAAAVVSFYEANRAHLAPFEPLRPPGFLTEAYWRERLAIDQAEFDAGVSMRLFLFEGDAVVGTANFTGIVRGAWHCCNLGYSLAAEREGHGLMHEALASAIAYAFGPLNLHRIQANHMPRNARSARVLARLGFVEEGRAKAFLRIAGRWEDHVLTSLTNPNWVEPC